MPQRATLGAAIRMRRGQLGLTQGQLAERIGNGVRQAEVSRLEGGRVALPRRERLEHIAAALDLSLGELLARSGWTGADEAFVPAGPDLPDPAPESTPVAVGILPVPKSVSRFQEVIAETLKTRERTAHVLQAARQTYAEACERRDAGWRRPPFADSEVCSRTVREDDQFDWPRSTPTNRDPDASAACSRAKSSPLDATPAPHIVAIDDAPEILDVYRSLFETEGYRVSTLIECTSEPVALMTLEPDLLVVDLRCGLGLGGLELLRRLRAHPDGGEVPAVVCTALSTSALSAISDELRFLGTHVLMKPFDLDELLDCVHQAIVGAYGSWSGSASWRAGAAH